MADEQEFPHLQQTVLDCMNVRELAEFYRQFLGYHYRPGDEPPTGDNPDVTGQDWVVLQDADGKTRLAFQRVDVLPEITWPEGPHPQMLHLDLRLPTREALDRHHERALELGARLLQDRSENRDEESQELVRVYADPAGHPFCLFVPAKREAG